MLSSSCTMPRSCIASNAAICTINTGGLRAENVIRLSRLESTKGDGHVERCSTHIAPTEGEKKSNGY